MFRKITIKNFKSLEEASTELGPFNVLVGNNGAGKSSFLQAIELASWTVKNDSVNDGLLSQQVDFRDLVYLRSPHAHISFEAELDIPASDASPAEQVSVKLLLAKKRYVYISNEIIKRKGYKEASKSPYGIESVRRRRVAWEGADNKILHENVALGHSMLRDVYLDPFASEKFPILYRVANHFMGYVHYEIWGPENLRSPSRSGRLLRTNGLRVMGLGKRGEELPGLLWNIREQSNGLQQLLDELRQIYPSIQAIQFKRGLEVDELGLQFVEQPSSSRGPLTYRPAQMSDGFMRILALLAIKYQPIPLALLGYEEPENGLHPNALDDCMRHLKEIARKGTQVIVTTHSPYLLNYLLEDEAQPRAELRLVLRDKSGRTTIAAPNSAKIERARRQGFGIGELWGMLLNEKDLATS